MTLYVIGGIAVLCLLYFISTQRSLVNLDEMANNALSQIGVQLQSRWDAIKGLVKLVEKYSAHEHETLKDMVAGRAKIGNTSTAQDVNKDETLLNSVMGRIIAVGEAYPDLKASEVYVEAMEGVNSYEENVRVSRMVYNDTATKMNRMVRQWPSSIVASMLHFGLREYLQTPDDKQDHPLAD